MPRLQLYIFGGCTAEPATTSTPADDGAYWIKPGTSKSLVWQRETMPVKRHMGVAATLPDGTVLIANGAQQGVQLHTLTCTIAHHQLMAVPACLCVACLCPSRSPNPGHPLSCARQAMYRLSSFHRV